MLLLFCSLKKNILIFVCRISVHLGHGNQLDISSSLSLSFSFSEYKVHSYNRNGLCALAFMDDHYPVRSAFSLLNTVSTIGICDLIVRSFCDLFGYWYAWPSLFFGFQGHYFLFWNCYLLFIDVDFLDCGASPKHISNSSCCHLGAALSFIPVIWLWGN